MLLPENQRPQLGFIWTPPSTSDKVLLLLNTQNTFQGQIVCSLNNVSYSLPGRGGKNTRPDRTRVLRAG
ncbi:hypothetical protein CUMW_216190 [Citrus unshiu]|uniref:Uncharacterized protein n=1 Tax=Citrus unshiu TaxID=55188 RepID=A0A2H5QCF1_CITUN|nr:hypothetical protein CUMW_216190 [Citrus unshiu]